MRSEITIASLTDIGQCAMRVIVHNNSVIIGGAKVVVITAVSWARSRIAMCSFLQLNVADVAIVIGLNKLAGLNMHQVNVPNDERINTWNAKLKFFNRVWDWRGRRIPKLSPCKAASSIDVAITCDLTPRTRVKVL